MDAIRNLRTDAQQPERTSATANLATAGGLLGALAACTCCILPLALFSLGVSGAWIGALTVLSPYQPLFMVSAIGALGCGYWLTYRKPGNPCADGQACARAAPGRFVRFGLWTATTLILLSAGWPWIVSSLL